MSMSVQFQDHFTLKKVSLFSGCTVSYDCVSQQKEPQLAPVFEYMPTYKSDAVVPQSNPPNKLVFPVVSCEQAWAQPAGECLKLHQQSPENYLHKFGNAAVKLETRPISVVHRNVENKENVNTQIIGFDTLVPQGEERALTPEFSTCSYSWLPKDSLNSPELSPNYPTQDPFYTRIRTNFTLEQKKTLEDFFKIEQFPQRVDRVMLSQQLRLTEQRVKIWFQNRRAKARRCGELESNPMTSVIYRKERVRSEKYVCTESQTETRRCQSQYNSGWLTSDQANILDNCYTANPVPSSPEVTASSEQVQISEKLITDEFQKKSDGENDSSLNISNDDAEQTVETGEENFAGDNLEKFLYEASLLHLPIIEKERATETDSFDIPFDI